MEYIALIKKDSFDCLFKYGRIHLNDGNSICIANHIDEYRNDSSLLKELFKDRDDFEMSFEYVLINYVIDANIIGGLVIRSGTNFIDNSIQHKLNALDQLMKGIK